MKIFFDTSAFAKRYVAEKGSEKVITLLQQADSLAVSVICLPELISTFSRLLREKKFSITDYQDLKNEVITELTDADICQITPGIITSVIALLEKYQLRTMDAIHVACALAVKSDSFVSADHRQLLAAKQSGLNTIDVS